MGRADTQLTEQLQQGHAARLLRVAGLVPGAFGGFASAADTDAFNSFSHKITATSGAAWCCRWARQWDPKS